MENKRKIFLIAGAILAGVLVCVILVGTIDGFWPWLTRNVIGEDYQGILPWGQEETTETTEQTEETGTEDTTETTSSQESTGDNSGSGSTGNTGSTDTGNSGSGNQQTEEDKKTDIKVDVITPEQEATLETKPSGSKGTEINFNDFDFSGLIPDNK